MEKEMMSCQRFAERIDAYLDNELAYDERVEMEEHARGCPECAERLDQTTRLLTMCAELDEGLVVPEGAARAWRSAVREEARGKPRARAARYGFGRRVASLMAACLVVALAVTTVRLGGARLNASDTGGAGKRAQYDMPETVSYEANYSVSSARGVESDGALTGDGAATGDALSSVETAKRVVLRSARREIDSTHYDTDLSATDDLVSEYGGYFEQRTETGKKLVAGQKTGRVATMTIRVPSDQLDAFLTSLDALGEVTYRSESAEDVSRRYAETELRLTVLRAQHARLTEMIASAQTVEEMIALEDKLSEVQMEIESYESDIRSWDSLASHSVVALTMTETAETDRLTAEDNTLGERIQNGFRDSMNWLMTFLEDAAVALAALAPTLVIWVPVGIIVIVLLRVAFRKPREKRKK